MSRILCVIDGMTDPGFRAERLPHLAAMELSRWVDTTRGGEPESLGCILRLLGVERVPPHLRGYAEAVGNGIPVQPADLVLRGSWFALDGSGRCTVPVPGPERLPVPEEGFCYHSLGQYKSLMIFPGLASQVADIETWPPYRCAGQPAGKLCPRGCEQLSRLFRALLGRERCLIPWGQSAYSALEPFPQQAAVVCGTPVVRGIGAILGMKLISFTGGTGDVDTDLNAKVRETLAAAKEVPFVLLHINGADEAAHRRHAGEKQAFLRRVDELVLAPLLACGHEVEVAADHGTDPVTGRHMAGLQPVYRNVC